MQKPPTAGPDGNLWFTESAGNNIGRISTRLPHLTLYAVGAFKLANHLANCAPVFYTDKQRLFKVG
jgi:streptogramin lyase